MAHQAIMDQQVVNDGFVMAVRELNSLADRVAAGQVDIVEAHTTWSRPPVLDVEATAKSMYGEEAFKPGCIVSMELNASWVDRSVKP